jgi:hypothetical protein
LHRRVISLVRKQYSDYLVRMPVYPIHTDIQDVFGVMQRKTILSYENDTKAQTCSHIHTLYRDGSSERRTQVWYDGQLYESIIRQSALRLDLDWSQPSFVSFVQPRQNARYNLRDILNVKRKRNEDESNDFPKRLKPSKDNQIPNVSNTSMLITDLANQGSD